MYNTGELYLRLCTGYPRDSGSVPPSSLLPHCYIFEEKVHRKDLARAEAFPLLIPRLQSKVLEHLRFPEEPRLERRISCTQVLPTERSLYMPLFIILQQQEEAADVVTEDLLRDEHPVPEVEVERTSVPYSSPPIPPPSAPDPTDTTGPSYTSQHSLSRSVLGS